ncbi:uncharacterized protein A4U43_C08F5570 [Asparagus officinalis]|uniref:probable LRR receptor-like serine/threonine-protein kinase At3g47570 n=1 Tax=Asparagus officinalis TaxID=4686 RepID=UPI00098E82DD|nr:probable LRR receptor-like serine/threonine-protein kinase At3g47570 [Asparagus officinalis]ONK59353.1 uncharacterized protein A4U43_C08F5570 [Asparagus officinalis]
MKLPKHIALISIHITLLTILASSETDDRFALLSFKSLLSDPTRTLSSWSNETLDPCKWIGVTCNKSGNPSRVTALYLDSFNLTGPISPSLSNLSFLTRLHLGNNKLTGRIPEELGQLQQLRYLNISYNSLRGDVPTSLSNLSSLQNVSFSHNFLHGEIPAGLSNCSDLRVLCLDNNMLVGTIPDSFASLKKLSWLYLSKNQLTGTIPAWIGASSSSSSSTFSRLDLASNSLTGGIPASTGNLSSLILLTLSDNRLEGAIPPSLGNCTDLLMLGLRDNKLEGTIPESLARLSNLKDFDVSFNELSGTVPSSLYNLTSLGSLSLGLNYFVGELPVNIGHTLPNLQQLIVQGNQFEGTIPVSLSNLSGIEVLDLAANKFSGVVPPIFGDLPYLYQLNLCGNQLMADDAEGWRFLASLTTCTQLSFLILCDNLFEGGFPSHITNLSTTLEVISLSGNQISGAIPAEIKNLESLATIDLYHNLLTGSIPESIGTLKSLQLLDFSHNRLSGEVPASLGNLSILGRLLLGENLFRGVIPTSFGNFNNLVELNLSYNQLDGIIPKEVVSISSLSQLLDLSHNSLSGPIPSEVGRLNNLARIDISYNKLSGKIPSTFGDCHVLQYLHLESNSLEGPIPSRLSELKGIEEVDISHNDISGEIPYFLSRISSLKSLNLSFNHFEGRVPAAGVFSNLSAVSLYGNNQLCGGDPKLKLPVCFIDDSKASRKIRIPVLIGIIVSVIVFVCLCFLSLIGVARYKKRKPRKLFPSVTFSDDHYRKVSYGELRKATDGFSSESLIGEGTFGSVYKGRINGYKNDVAIKVLKLQERGGFNSFMAECEALRNIRHRNLAKILTSCSTIDVEGNEFRALVFEFMPHGSLEEWLHPKGLANFQACGLGFTQRLNIGIDVASAVEYLHHNGDTPIVHCDLKPSNVLLDNDMNARVTDFGLARFLNGNKGVKDQDASFSVGIKGSIGYIAPEYGISNQVSTQGDVYSYGILLLEILTRKRPTDDMFQNGITLREFVEKSFPDKILEIVDPQLFSLEKNNNGDNLNRSTAEELLKGFLLSLIKIGLCCSRENPNARPHMRNVVTEMDASRSAYFSLNN